MMVVQFSSKNRRTESANSDFLALARTNLSVYYHNLPSF